MNKKIQLETPSLFGDYKYPEVKAIMEKQQDIVWYAQEIKVENDIHDFLTKMTDDEFKLVNVTLSLFVEIEQTVGKIWAKVEEWFPHSEIEGACSAIAAMEKSVHAFFYQKMNDVLNIAPEDTEKAQKTVKELKKKLKLLNDILENADNNKPLTLATVAFIEQVLLFSNFAMLKSFQANGNNLAPNTISGVDYVVNDEVLHGELAAYLFNTYNEEMKALNVSYDMKELERQIVEVARVIIEHEDAVIDYLFETDDKYISGINRVQLKQFIRSRINYVAATMKIQLKYDITDTTIADWFYKGANAIKIHDFFVKGTNSYTRTWSEEGFSRMEFLDAE